VEVATDRSRDRLNLVDDIGSDAGDGRVAEPASGDAPAGESVADEVPAGEPQLSRDQHGQPQPPRNDRDGPGSRRLDLANVITGVLAVLLMLAVVAVALLAQQVAQTGREERLRAEALAAARQMVVNFTTLDYRKFDESADRVLAMSGGNFRQQYANASSKLERLVKENETVSRGEVLAAGIVSFDPDSARVLVVADADVTNVATKKPQLRTYRLQLDLGREGDEWKVVELEFVG
jgi:Mce-associated membrane protein